MAQPHDPLRNADGSPSMTWAGFNPCGCVSMLAVDSLDTAEEMIRTGQRRKEMERLGLTVKLVPTASIHSGETSLRPCENNPDCKRHTRATARQRSRGEISKQEALF